LSIPDTSDGSGAGTVSGRYSVMKAERDDRPVEMQE
jgi:hypothetical protein